MGTRGCGGEGETWDQEERQIELLNMAFTASTRERVRQLSGYIRQSSGQIRQSSGQIRQSSGQIRLSSGGGGVGPGGAADRAAEYGLHGHHQRAGMSMITQVMWLSRGHCATRTVA